MNRKKALIICMVMIIILCMIIGVIISKLKNTKKEIEFHEEVDSTIKAIVNIQEMKDEMEIFKIQKCVTKYLKALNDENTDVIINLLNKEYMSNNDITKENILQKLDKLENGFEEFKIKKINMKTLELGIKHEYYVYGEIIEKDYTEISPIYIVVKLDLMNETFDVTPQQSTKMDEEEYFKILEKEKSKLTGEEIDLNGQKSSSIEENKDNSYKNMEIRKEQILKYYFDDFVMTAAYNPEAGYELLDEEYRNKRFKNIEEFKNYIEKNKSKILNASIREYKMTEEDEYKQFIIIDTNDNYYIFKVTDFMEYTVVLDFYTTDIEEVTIKYDEGNEKVKCNINIQKIVAAINDKNYKYVYSKLSEGFKDNYYKTYEEFENYMSEIFVGNLDMSFEKFTNEGDTYIYDIVFQGTTASNNTKIEMQIIMQLKENRDFIISFNIQE